MPLGLPAHFIRPHPPKGSLPKTCPEFSVALSNVSIKWTKKGLHWFDDGHSHHKHLNHGDYLIDDREKNGADKFVGELILFGGEKYPDWKSVMSYLIP